MIRLVEVGKQYPGGTIAVGSLSMDVRRGELIALVGPSGCGKSTTLRMVNRLVEPTSGTIEVEGQDVAAMDPVELRRGMGYVIQRIGLFPHQRVAQNVATVPRLLGWDADRIRNRVEELLELVGLDPRQYGRRYPHQLSGGEQQRVGVARALGADPPVLLMDEPFGAVDPLQRNRLQGEFLQIQATLRKTVLLVTHDIDEAIRLADRIAVLSPGGRLEQLADPRTLLTSPATPAVSAFLGGDAGLRRLDVITLSTEDLEPAAASPSAAATATRDDGRDRLRLGMSLRRGFAALISSPHGRVEVLDPDGRVAGVLTADGVLAALRR